LLHDAIAVGSEPTSSAPDVTRAPERGPVGRAVHSGWLWAGLFAAASGLWRIGRPEMWQDELVTLDVAARPWRHITHLLASVDAVHGAYYLFMHGWMMAFGESPTAVRTPSALAMAGAAAGVALIGRRLFGDTAGLLGGLLFTLIPAVTRFAQEARSYAFVTLAATLATLMLLRAVERSTFLRWAGYALCITAVTCLNTVALGLLAGHLVGLVLLSEDRRDWRGYLRFAIAVLAGLLPASGVIYLGSHQASRQVLWIPHDPPWVVWSRTFGSAWVAGVVTALALLACLRYRRRAAVGLAMAVAPLVLIGLGSLGQLSYFFSKYLLFDLTLWAVLAGAGLTAVRWRSVSVAGLALVAALAVPGQLAMRADLSHSWYTYPGPRPRAPLAYSTTAKMIADGYRPGDGVIYLRAQFWWLMHDIGVPYYLPDRVAVRDVFLSRTAADGNALNAAECSASVMCVGTEPRIWVVIPFHTANPLGLLSDDQRRALTLYHVARLEYPSGMTLALLERTD
jgi:mannosyltransferase